MPHSVRDAIDAEEAADSDTRAKRSVPDSEAEWRSDEGVRQRTEDRGIQTQAVLPDKIKHTHKTTLVDMGRGAVERDSIGS